LKSRYLTNRGYGHTTAISCWRPHYFVYSILFDHVGSRWKVSLV